MALETFDFPYHLVSTENPDSGYRGSLGGNYTFTSEPTAPDQRKFTLSFKTMKYFTDVNNSVVSDVNMQYNMLTLTQFYYRHKLYKSFYYIHPVHGQMEVKFNKPLIEPEVLEGGTGAVKSFTVELIEIL